MQREDRFHHSITVASDAALDAYHAGIDAMFALQPGALDHFDVATAIDPEFAMGFAARARAHLARADVAAAREDAERAMSLASHRTERERQHIQIVADGLRGRGSIEAIYAHARAYPRDAIPISGALGVYGLIAFSGIADHHEVQLDFLRSLEPYWRDDWWFDTSRGWARIEGGQVDEGLDIALRAFEANRANAQGVHAISHGYYERGDVLTGAAFLDEWLAMGINGAPYSVDGGLHCHLSWHRALIALQLGDFETMHAIYSAAIAPSASSAIPMLTFIDAAALAFRAHLAGEDLGAHALEEIAAFDAAHFQAGITFLDVHRLLARLSHSCSRSGENENEYSRLGTSHRAPGYRFQYHVPPTSVPASNTRTLKPSPRNRWSAYIPAKPPPTTMTSNIPTPELIWPNPSTYHFELDDGGYGIERDTASAGRTFRLKQHEIPRGSDRRSRILYPNRRPYRAPSRRNRRSPLHSHRVEPA